MKMTFLAGVLAIFSLATAPMASGHTGVHAGAPLGWHAHGWGWFPALFHHVHGPIDGHAHTHAIGAHHRVAAHALNVRSGPSAHHEVIDSLHRGDHVVVLGCNHHNWCVVGYGHHHQGWVSAKYLH